MPYTRHGHAYGIMNLDEPKPIRIARCGGPAICDVCKTEIDMAYIAQQSECNGICVTAADLGLPEIGIEIAYPHPECPLHGDKRRTQ